MNRIQKVRTPGGVLALIAPTAAKLLADGVISGTLDGDLHAADAATVKAAIMASSVCDFCSTPGASHYYDVPDFGIGNLPGNMGAGASTGGWMACDECDAMIRDDKREKLVERAISTHAFPKFSRRAVEELYGKFWRGMDDRADAAGVGAALGDYIEDRLPKDVAQPTITSRDRRVDRVCQMTGLSHDEVSKLLDGQMSRDTVAKLSAVAKQFGQLTGEGLRAGRRYGAALDKMLAEPHKPLAEVIPHWQRALDGRFQALANLSSTLAKGDRMVLFKESIDLRDQQQVAAVARAAQARATLRDLGFDEDAKLLRVAQAYSFNAETSAAIREAASGVPHDVPLSAIETPNEGAGWFWFAEPLPITASPIASDAVHALLWGWQPGKRRYKVSLDADFMRRVDPSVVEQVRRTVGESGDSTVNIELLKEIFTSAKVTQEEYDMLVTPAEEGDPSIVFSAYVVDEKGAFGKEKHPYPSTRWHWPVSQSFHDMLAFNAVKWDEAYGPGGPHHGDPHLISKDDTLRCIAELSLFFIMSALWFKQTVPSSAPILTREPGHVERHARKRLQREHKLAEPPSVQVVALRKSLRVPAEKTGEQGEGSREYHYRWIVRGHSRLQACGPGRKDRKLIWVEAFTKGPDDKPLRVREKVFAVIR